MDDKTTQFKQALDDHHQWPCPYIFKFIVPTENLEQLIALFPGENVEKRESRSGKYTSVTMTSNMCSSTDVMSVYEKAATVPGLMSL